MESEQSSKEFIGVRDLTEMFGLSEAAIYGLRHSRQLPNAARVGRRLMWRRSDIELWFDERSAGDRANESF